MKKSNGGGLVLIGAVLMGALFCASTVKGQTADQLVLTESSSTSLTATLNGSALTVLLTSPDHWLVGLQGVTGTGLFAEPESSTEANLVEGIPSSTALVDLTVTSDDAIAGAVFTVNGGTDTTDFHEVNGAVLDVTFHDLGDVPSAPDSGSTLSLLGFSLAAIGLCRNWLGNRLKA